MANDSGYVEEHAGQEQPEKLTPAAEADHALVQEIIDNFALVSSIESEQRRQEQDDLEFEGISQWLPDHLASRAEHIDEATGRKVPARPALTINLVERPVQQIVSEARGARLGISVQPKAGLANTTMAGYYKGLIRSIQADSGATGVRLWSLERVAKCGRGAYRILTEFNNDGDFDLDLVIRRILNQETVYWDPYAQMADQSDADWVILTDWMSERERLRRWPTLPLVPTAGAFESADHPWFAIDDHKHTSVRIAEYYKVVYTKVALGYHPAVGSMALDQMPPDLRTAVMQKAPSTRMREPEARHVLHAIVDGSQVLERDRWVGRYLPVIPVTGKEYNVKGKRSWKGAVTNAKDLNRGFNVAISSAVEAAGSMPRAPYIMYAGQDDGFEEMWDDSPIKAYTRLYVNMMEVEGKPAPLPQRQNQEPAIQGALFLARVLHDGIDSLTGIVDPARRATNPYDRSGKAIEALQRQGAAGTSNFLDNLATISMPQEGRVLIDAIAKVYDRPGRIIGVMGEETDDEKAIMLKVPFVLDKDGTPVPVPCPACQGRGLVTPPRTFRNIFPAPQVCPECQGRKTASEENMPEEFDGQQVKYVDLSRGQFKVTVSVGRNYQTKQEEAMGAMTELASAAPALVPLYADLWVRSMGFSGANEIADRIKRQNPAAQDEDQTQKIPPEFAAKFQALTVEHQAAMEALQKATDAIRTDAVKMEGQKALQAMKAEAAEGLQHLRQQDALMQATNVHAQSTELEVLKGDLEAMRQEAEQRHEVLLQLLKEQSSKDLERHKASLHDQAAAAAARDLPSS